MAGLSDIEWTDATWNPIAGCAMVSPGCTNCYAMRMAARLQSMDHPSYRGTTRKSGGRPVWTGKVNLVRKALDIPLRWKKPRKIFVNSMSDLFQDGVPPEFIAEVWNTMVTADHHVYQILTKRPENMKQVIESLELKVASHIWLGTSVESEKFVERVSILRDTPAASGVRLSHFWGRLDLLISRAFIGQLSAVSQGRAHVQSNKNGYGKSRLNAVSMIRHFSSNNGGAPIKRPRAGNITAERGMSIQRNQRLGLSKGDYCHGASITSRTSSPPRNGGAQAQRQPACARSWRAIWARYRYSQQPPIHHGGYRPSAGALLRQLSAILARPAKPI